MQTHCRTTFRSRVRGVAATTMAGSMAVALTIQSAHAATCKDQLETLLKEWNAISYSEPSKPAQARVTGNFGHVNTGFEVEYMRNQMRLAFGDCDAGKEKEALRRISAIHRLLDRKHGT